MSSHYGFSDSDDEFANTAIYECSDPNHCDKGDSCDGEHGYSRHYIEEWVVQSDVTVKTLEHFLMKVLFKSPSMKMILRQSLFLQIQLNWPPLLLRTRSSDDLDLDVEADSEDACSRSPILISLLV
ncbi:hypothetical protein ACET3Z_013301 [Daucus carota]